MNARHTVLEMDSTPNASLSAEHSRLLTHGTVSVTELAAAHGIHSDHASHWATSQRAKHRLITVTIDDVDYVPKFIVDSEGHPHKHLVPLLHVLLPAGITGFSAWEWLQSPSTRLAGCIPSEVAISDVGTACCAARRYTQRAHALKSSQHQ